jgi:hypothetical protein
MLLVRMWSMALAKLTKTGDVQAINSWARPEVYEAWLGHLRPTDYQAIRDAMNLAVNDRDVVRANYIVCRPDRGDEWFEVYAPVYDAMGQSYELARKFIGLILWEAMWHRTEQWYFQKIDKTIVNELNLVEDIQVMEYFRASTLPQASHHG